MGRQTSLEIQCLYGNPMSNNFYKTSLRKIRELETLGTRKRILRTNLSAVAVLKSVQ